MVGTTVDVAVGPGVAVGVGVDVSVGGIVVAVGDGGVGAAQAVSSAADKVRSINFFMSLILPISISRISVGTCILELQCDSMRKRLFTVADKHQVSA
jgi:hypothetical protein